ncbi:PAS domain-containing sensor histidine kinase [Pandoraea apista]|uniref:histidine kinase n=1 Tax=Pandoraea apista TaxID=93218 RepID=A0A5E5P223_9BURK|nr:PAS domain S-box protein [Pandoraea apista]VVG70622.1 PAS domain-containing sensor histidine kinase [Pandoraea apista]
MLSPRLANSAPPSRSATPPARSNRWLQGFAESHYYLLVPLVSIVIFLVVMSLILWSLNRRETEQQQDTLYRNVAWAQQQIRLNMLAIQDQISSLARDTAAKPQDVAHFQNTASELMQNHADIVFMNWLDASQRPKWAVPADSPFASRLQGSAQHPMEDELLVAFRAARDSRRSAYSTLIYDASGASYIVVQVPVLREREFLGTISAVYSVEGLLIHELPQELGDKFKVSFIDTHNNELATTSTRPPLPRDVSYELLLDPPGHSLAVRIYSYPAVGNFVNNTLVWLIAGLSCFVLWSLWSLWRHTRQRFEAQQALFNETSFRRAMENSIVIGMRVLDLQGHITYVNPAFCRMTGWDEPDLMNRAPPYPYWPKDDIHEMQRRIDMTLRGKAPSHGFEIRVQRKDGTIFYARMFVSPLVDAHGRQTGWMSSLTDISEPKRAREELAAAHERFTTVLESLDASVSVLAVDKAELLFANRYYRQLFGTRPEGHLELSGGGELSPASLDHIDMVDAFAGLPAASLTDTAAETQEIYLPTHQKWFEVRRQYIQWVDGHLAQLQVATDITARRHAEELARQEEERLQFTGRLTTMGEMASSLAHELNQPLAAINNYCMGTAALVRAGRTSPETLLPALEKTSQQAVRAGMIIKRIRAFVKRSEPKRQPSSIYEIVADAVGLAEIEARKRRIRIVTELPAGLPQINVDPVLIEQVLVNLLKNAAEAMHGYTPPPGQRRDSTVRLHVERRDKSIEFQVSDHGPGVDEATIERLFEPFFSTKSDGMGMGLNICRSIIESHHGRLWVENNEIDGVRNGCTFCILLPLEGDTTSGSGGGL